jgi:hypothetical protein
MCLESISFEPASSLSNGVFLSQAFYLHIQLLTSSACRGRANSGCTYKMFPIAFHLKFSQLLSSDLEDDFRIYNNNNASVLAGSFLQ